MGIWLNLVGHGIHKVYAMSKLAGREGFYFDATAPDCPYFNVLSGKEDEVIETVTTVFIMLSPESNSYFQNLTINLLRYSIMILKRIEAAYTDSKTGISSRPATLLELNDLISNNNGKGIRLAQEISGIPCLTPNEAAQNQEAKDYFMNTYFADRSKVYQDTSNVRAQISNLIQNKYLRRVLNPPTGRSDIDFDDIIANEKILAISTSLGKLRDLGSYLGYFLIFTLQSSIFRREGNEYTRKPCFFYMDEANKYLNEGFADILTMGRSFRVAVILASQSRELLAEKVASEHKKAFLTNISANLRNVVIFPGICTEDAQYYSKDFGDIIKTEVRHGESRQSFSLGNSLSGKGSAGTTSTQYSEKEAAEFSASDIKYDSFKTAMYRIIKDNTIQRARKGVMTWLPKDIDNKINATVSLYREGQDNKAHEQDENERKKREEMYAKFQKDILENPTKKNSVEKKMNGEEDVDNERPS